MILRARWLPGVGPGLSLAVLGRKPQPGSAVGDPAEAVGGTLVLGGDRADLQLDPSLVAATADISVAEQMLLVKDVPRSN